MRVEEILEQLRQVCLLQSNPEDLVEVQDNTLLVCVTAAEKSLSLGWLFTVKDDLTLTGRLWTNLFPRVVYGEDQKKVVRAVGRLERIIDAVEDKHASLLEEILNS